MLQGTLSVILAQGRANLILIIPILVSVLLKLAPPYFLTQGFSLRREFTSSARLADQQTPGLLLSSFPGILDSCCSLCGKHFINRAISPHPTFQLFMYDCVFACVHKHPHVHRCPQR